MSFFLCQMEPILGITLTLFGVQNGYEHLTLKSIVNHVFCVNFNFCNFLVISSLVSLSSKVFFLFQRQSQYHLFCY